MADYEWEIEHRCSDEDLIRDVLNDCGFTKASNEEYLYKRKIRDWETMEIRIKSERTLEIVCEWMGDTTTETYFDYLIHCGMRVGMFIDQLERRMKEQDLILPEKEDEVKKLEEPEGEDEESEEG